MPAFLPRALLQPRALLDHRKFTMENDPASIGASHGLVIIEKRKGLMARGEKMSGAFSAKRVLTPGMLAFPLSVVMHAPGQDEAGIGVTLPRRKTGRKAGSHRLVA